MFDHPVSDQYLDVQVARAAAALPGAGAYDATPNELRCPGFHHVTLFVEYTRGGAAGAFAFRVQTSPVNTGDVWHQSVQYAGAILAAGTDSQSDIQREAFEYQATGAAIEKYVYGPIDLEASAERIRIPCAETGNVGAPGTVKITAVFD